MDIVLDDIIYYLQQTGGISTYWYELSRRIKSEQVRHVDFHINSADRFSAERDIDSTLLIPGSKLPVQLRRYLPVNDRVSAPHIFHSSYYRYSTSRSALNVSTVYDFAYEWFRHGLAQHVHHWQKSAAIAHSNAVICISKSTMEDFCRYYPHFHGKVKMIYIGISEEYRILPAVEKKQQVLFVGERSGYKNFGAVVDAIALLGRYSLAIGGGRELRREEREKLDARLPGRYTHFNSISNERLNLLYNESHCLVYPSSYEGFGIPVGEAMRAGCPVVAGSAPALAEVGGDAALYLQAATGRQIADAIVSLEERGRRNDLIRKGEKHARQFSWDRTAKETIALYEEMA
jgi:mannosyltransferase